MPPQITKKVVYTRSSIKQIVNILDPKPPKEIAYEFSNGRKFYRKEGT